MYEAIDSQYLIPFDGSFCVAQTPTIISDIPGKKEYKRKLEDQIDYIDNLQRRLYASDQHSVLLIFQAMDAAGKDSTIRAVMRGVDPAGCEVSSFKQPSAEELDHDFLWRSVKRLPQRGRIGVFNRSYYEETLVVRVHTDYLKSEKLPHNPPLDTLWQERFESIQDMEKHLARNGTMVLKFWLNVSQEEQHKRFLSRLDDKRKNWKFSSGDVEESARWDDYMQAYEAALNATSKPWAPWFAIPADNKPAMRLAVSSIIIESMEKLGVKYPEVTQKEKRRFEEMRKLLGKF
ncbi:MAG: PPK2 family polyphosphate kinase [Gammaproteobacteria bacterium]